MDLFLEAHREPPMRIVIVIDIDIDATDDPLYGNQNGRHFHGYYDSYCYLPLCVFCGRHLLAAKPRSSANDAAGGAIEEDARIVAHIRRHWPRTTIVIRADSGFCRDDPMSWCEENGVQFVLGMASNERCKGGQFVLGAMSPAIRMTATRSPSSSARFPVSLQASPPAPLSIVATADRQGLQVHVSHTRGITSPTIRRELRRRNAIEAVIGHMKQDGHLERNALKGAGETPSTHAYPLKPGGGPASPI